MAGMFDALFSDENASDLALAAGLLGGRGNLNSILSQSLMSAQAAGQGAKQRARQMEMDLLTQQRFQLDLDEANRRKKQQDSLDAFRGSIPSPDGVGPDGVGPPMQVGRNEMLMHGAMKAGALDPLQYLQLQQKDNAPRISKPGDIARDAQGNIIWQNPQEPKTNPFVELLKVAGIDPNSPQGKKFLADKVVKDSSHQPAVNVSYQAPIPAMNPQTGKVELVRPDNKGGMSFTGIQPPPQNRDVKLPAEIQRMNIAADTMGSMLDRYSEMLDKYNPRDPMVQANPAIRAEFQSLMKGIQLQFKEVQALGALAGPDVAIMEAAVTDPFTFKGAFYGRGGLKSQIKQAKTLLQERKTATEKSQGRPGEEAPKEDNDPLGLRK